MRIIIIMSLLSLVSCGSGYEIKGPYESVVNSTRLTYYECIHSKPVFFFDLVLKKCTELKECNDFCEEKRSKDK